MKKILSILILIVIWYNSHAQLGFMHSQQISHSTNFGLNQQGMNATDEIAAAKLIGVKFLRDAEGSLSSYNTGVFTSLQQRYNGGMRVILNINWGAGSQPRLFPTNMTTYGNKLDTFLKYNAQFLNGGGVCIENEPLNMGFYDWTAGGNTCADYILELQTASAICKKYNVRMADGGTHLAYYSHGLCSGSGDVRARRADTIWDAEASLPMGWVNYHFDGSVGIGNDSALNAGVIRTDAICAHDHTGHGFGSNEWHQTDNGTVAQQNKLAASIVTQTRLAHSIYALIFGGDPLGSSPDALPIVNPETNVITPLGTAYKNAIASNQ